MTKHKRKEKKMTITLGEYRAELWKRMCAYEGEFTLAHAKHVFEHFDCDECPNKGDECDGCPIKKAETTITNSLWEASATK